ncbi:phenoloxidase-activating factor 2 [Agrilus planipennis]|uniref:Phenoloxidase-activating factor 2 n=1 Tax=Agrilus planipennis TaxID=224129 RepID=A0A7F5RFC2_AGRPL|nr:phenoloxidase-activating factor 2 [Agrilus planipennis]
MTKQSFDAFMMFKLTIVICFLFNYFANSQDLDSQIQSLVDQVFPKPNISSTDNRNKDNEQTGVNLQPSGDGQDGQDMSSCLCVPYYLCKNGSLIKDGVGIIDIRIQDNPCSDYLETCCGSSERVVDPITPKPDPAKTIGCGHHNPEGVGFRITGNKDNEAQFGEFPWMTAVLREEELEGQSSKLNVYQCGGALIHRQVVLTAAHCVTDKTKKFKVRVGEWDTQTKKELYPHQDRNVEKIMIHPEFYAGALFNDVALLFLESPVELAENVNVICLPPQGAVIDHARCYASGWGKDVFGKEGKYQVILKKIDLPIVPRQQCQNALRTTRLGKFFELHKSFVCAGGEAGKDTCKGDGGSPLVCPVEGTKDVYHQVGIVAWGIGCGENQVPGVYANIALFRDWIDEQMAYHNFDRNVYSY